MNIENKYKKERKEGNKEEKRMRKIQFYLV